MELKQGYKQTEIGVIPEDWEVKCISDIVEVDSDNLPSQTNPNYFFNYISLEDVDNGQLRNYSEQIFKNAPSRARRKIRKGDVLISTVRPNLKSHLLISNDVKDFVCSTGFAVLRNNGKIDSIFLYNHFFSSIINRQIENLITGSNYPAINSKEVKSLIIPIPTFHEQTAIANALSDMDALISQTEKLIEKKKAIKHGAMQELLKPKDGWVTKKFTDVVNYIHGKAHEQFIVENGKYEVVNSKFISTEGTVKKYADVSFLTAKKGDVLTVLSDLPNGKALAKCFYVEEDNKYAVNQRICIWRSTSDYPKFLFYFLNRHKYFMAINDGVSQTHILNGHIEKFFIEIPENYSEQQSIAETLWDIDKELQLLETKLTKLKQHKQGMMQALLTGKIRLVS